MSKLEEREAVTKRKRITKTTVTDDNTEKTEQTDKLIQRSYYLTDKLQKAITIKTAEGDLDKSGVVREALKLYLADILEKI
ncbi:hypothetical protein [Desulfosporosinus nitroreducens]|uniref:hypothetical protein n=1 Tax=Desulfosporosinus nitroreducens TaxID=2018668 RepID=UPI00207C5290|nr:hypothetical protein [Desulfosporosinus nitroreducens]MCO1604633.1 hypothetical protein [Desulfosporosinus nitroreducens]